MPVESGRYGVFSIPLEVAPRREARGLVAEVERLGFGTIWTGEGLGTRDVLVSAAVVLADTERIVFGASIANIYGRDPSATVMATRTLLESFPGRFQLGLGVSHVEQVDPRGHSFGKPVSTMRAYLDAMDDAPFVSPLPEESVGQSRVPRLVAALRPRMLALAGERADGALPFMTLPAHTATAREILGPGKFLAPAQGFLLERDASEARRIIRAHLAWFLTIGTYRAILLLQGFTEEDLAGGGSDRLVDALVPWGDEASVAARIREHFDAGADHVVVHAVSADLQDPALDQYRRIAPALLR